MADPYSTSISVIALVVSCVTLWLTFLKRGKVKMTQPTVIFFGLESPLSQKEVHLPKIFLSTLHFFNVTASPRD